MTDTQRESGRKQELRILHKIDNLAKRLYEKQNGQDEKVKIKIWEILQAAEVSRSTFYHINYPQKINHRAGLWYDHGNLTIKPETYLRNRGSIDLSDLNV